MLPCQRDLTFAILQYLLDAFQKFFAATTIRHTLGDPFQTRAVPVVGFLFHLEEGLAAVEFGAVCWKDDLAARVDFVHKHGMIRFKFWQILLERGNVAFYLVIGRIESFIGNSRFGNAVLDGQLVSTYGLVAGPQLLNSLLIRFERRNVLFSRLVPKLRDAQG